MAHLIENSYSSWQLTPDEEIAGATFTITQMQMLQNEMAKDAQLLLSLEYDATNATRFIQEQASLKGRIELIQYLIDCSNAMKDLDNPELNPE